MLLYASLGVWFTLPITKSSLFHTYLTLTTQPNATATLNPVRLYLRIPWTRSSTGTACGLEFQV